MRLRDKFTSLLRELQRMEEPPPILPFPSRSEMNDVIDLMDPVDEDDFLLTPLDLDSELPGRPPQRVIEDEGDDEFLEEIGRQEAAEDERYFLEQLRQMQEDDEDEAILLVARQRAGEEAQQTEVQRKKLELEKSMKDGRFPSLDPLREKIDMAKKPRCRTIEQYLCDRCDFVIAKATDGFVIEGNIYTADPTKPGGLVGNNFPEPEGR